jgi:hypothetical protein
MLAPFSAGRLFGKRTDLANQTPIEFGVLQNISFSHDFTTKPLFGKSQLALFVPRANLKMTLKAEVATFSGDLFNAIFWGQSLASGGVQAQLDETHSVPATTPFTITATYSSTFSQDEGVVYASNGATLTYTTGAPTAAGQYAQAAGTYTFSSSDASAQVGLNYLFTTTAGQKIAISNQAMGYTPFFQAVFRNQDPRSGLFSTYVINRVVASKWDMSPKLGDWAMSSFEMEVMDDGTGQIGTLSFGDTA